MNYSIISKNNISSDIIKSSMPFNCTGHAQVSDRKSLLLSLSAAVEKNQAVLIIWDLSDTQNNISKILSKAVGLPALSAGVAGEGETTEFFMPQGAVPFTDSDSNVYGYSLESGSQCILVLTDIEEAWEYAFSQIVVPYLAAKSSPLSEEKPAEQACNAAPKEIEEILTEPLEPIPQSARNYKNQPVSDFEWEEAESEDDAEYIAERPRKSVSLAVKLLCVLVVLALLGGGAFVGYDKFFAANLADSTYKKLSTLLGKTSNKEMPPHTLPEFGALYEENAKIAGWIKIEGVKIDYPVMLGSNSNYYKNHLPSGIYNKYGSPYLPNGYAPIEYNQNTVIKANNYSDGRMFSNLRKYLDKAFYEKHPSVNFDTLYEKNKWKIFAAFITETNPSKNEFSVERKSFLEDSEFIDFVAEINKRSLFTSELDVNENDVLLTLLTPYPEKAGYSIAVVARKLRFDESPVDVGNVEINANALFPKGWKSGGGYKTLPQSVRIALALANAQQPEDTVPAFADFEDTGENISVPSTSSEISNSSSSAASYISSEALSSGVNGATSAVSSKKSALPSSPVKASSVDTPASSVVSSPVSSVPSAVTPPNIGNLTVTNQSTGVKITDTAENVIAMVVEAEMGSGFHIEALKAQAVTAYTWIVNKGDTAPGVPVKAPGARALEATRSVLGELVKYKGERANVFYSAMSAGRTAVSKDVWGGSFPYLISVDSSIEKSVKNFQTVRTYSEETVANLIENVCGVDLTQTADRNKWFNVTYDSNNLYSVSVRLGDSGASISGLNLRMNVFNDKNVGSSNSLRSHAYRITYYPESKVFSFTVQGYGHGVGMSQYGANLYAQSKGWSYKQIIAHYFPGTTISR